MYKHIFSVLLLKLHVPLQIGKCTLRGTCRLSQFGNRCTKRCQLPTT